MLNVEVTTCNLKLAVFGSVLIPAVFSISIKTRDLEEKCKSLTNSYQIPDENQFSIPGRRISIASISSSQLPTMNIFGFRNAFHLFTTLSAFLIDSVVSSYIQMSQLVVNPHLFLMLGKRVGESILLSCRSYLRDILFPYPFNKCCYVV